jgi:lysyl-tRNA synthetase class 1
LPNKKYLEVNSDNKIVFQDMLNVLKSQITESDTAEEIQTLLYEVGKKHQFDNLKDFFKLVYQVLLGQEQGPRLGSFIKLYGVQETIKIIEERVNFHE